MSMESPIWSFTDVSGDTVPAAGDGMAEEADPVDLDGSDVRVLQNVKHIINVQKRFSRGFRGTRQKQGMTQEAIQIKKLFDAVTERMAVNLGSAKPARLQTGSGGSAVGSRMAGFPLFSIDNHFGPTGTTAPTLSGTDNGYPNSGGTVGTAVAFSLSTMESAINAVYDGYGQIPDICAMSPILNRKRARFELGAGGGADKMRLDAPEGRGGRISKNVTYVDYVEGTIMFISDKFLERGTYTAATGKTTDAIVVTYFSDQLRVVEFDGWGLKLSDVDVRNPGTRTCVATSEITCEYASPSTISVIRGIDEAEAIGA